MREEDWKCSNCELLREFNRCELRIYFSMDEDMNLDADFDSIVKDTETIFCLGCIRIKKKTTIRKDVRKAVEDSIKENKEALERLSKI